MAGTVRRRPKPRRAKASDARRDCRTPEVLDFVRGVMAVEDDALRAIRENTVADGLPAISIGPDEGKLLHLLIKSCGAKKAVEVGTLAGYSGTWIARALGEKGRLHTFEYESKHAAVARRNFERAGVAARVSVHVGAARETLREAEGEAPFDFVFIDADKVNYPHYLRWAITHTRPGAIIACDNAYLFGKIHIPPNEAGDDAHSVLAMRGVLSVLADEAIFSSCAMLPTGEGLAVGVRK